MKASFIKKAYPFVLAVVKKLGDGSRSYYFDSTDENGYAKMTDRDQEREVILYFKLKNNNWQLTSWFDGVKGPKSYSEFVAEFGKPKRVVRSKRRRER